MLFAKYTVATLLVVTALGPVVHSPARADSADDALARVQTLEKEIAAIKKENEALRRVKDLREQNTALVKQTTSPSGRPTAHFPPHRDPKEAYAADLPMYAKAPAPQEPGRLRLWGEGGAIWSG